jgi:hypothetical protein
MGNAQDVEAPLDDQGGQMSASLNEAVGQQR